MRDLDSQANGQQGGTGQAFDWAIIKDSDKAHIMLAGGLNEQNIEQALALNPLGLDLNSGVESAPGIKSADKIQQLFERIISA